MKIIVKDSTMVRAASNTPQQPLWSSNMDLVMPNVHEKSVYFYNNSYGSPNFFDAKVLKDSLSRALVLFYPMAGRLGRDKNGRLEIECNNAGVLFVEAETDSTVADFGDFTLYTKLFRLVPVVDYSQGMSSYPLAALQVTYFKCGGVSLGLSSEHHAADGTSAFHFVNTWSEIARGSDPTVIPFIDRTLLRARDPPKPTFNHIEYQIPPPQKRIAYIETIPTNIDISIFKLTRDQINSLKCLLNCNGNTIRYTTFEILAGHLWRCVCRARELPNDQETKLFIDTNGRARLRPPLPQGYFGNVIFTATSIGLANDIVSKPAQYATSKIHEALAKMGDDYLRSVVDYFELEPIKEDLFCGPLIQYPNLEIISWAKLGINDADFGWGLPVFNCPGEIFEEGQCYVFPSEDSFFVALSLQKEHMKSFRKYLYEI